MTQPAQTTPNRPTATQRAVAYVLLLITMVIWASAFAGLRRVLQEVDALTLTTARMVFAGGAMALFGLFMRIGLPTRRDLPAVIAAGLTGHAFYHLALNFGLATITAGLASFIIATIPIWTALFARKFLGERLSKMGMIGLLVSFLGVCMLSVDLSGATFSTGAILVLAASLCAAVNMTLQKRLLERYSALDLSIHVTAFGTLPFLFYIPFCVGSLTGMSPEAWGITLYLGVGPICLGGVLSMFALRVLSTSRAAQMMLLVPPIASLIAWLWLGEIPKDEVFWGGGLILLGVFLGGINRWVARSEPALEPNAPAAGVLDC